MTRRHLLIGLAALLVSLILGSCAGNSIREQTPQPSNGGSKYATFRNWAPLMNEVVSPFQEMFIHELTKDPEATDFPKLEAKVQEIAHYFALANNPDSPLFMADPEQAGHAKTALAWFLSMAEAASAKDQRKLEGLFSTRRNKTCTLCHD